MENYPFAAIPAVVVTVCLCGLLVRIWRALRRERAENCRLRKLIQLGGGTEQVEPEDIRRLHHDLRHYLRAADGFPLPDSALERLSRAMEKPEVPFGSDRILSALVDHYRSEALDLGVQIDLLLQLDSEVSMLPDLCLLVSNLLENAVEALQREGRGWLRARSMSTEGYISLVVGNSCSTPLRSIGGRYLSSKSPHRLGMGLDTIERIARKYGGQAEFACENEEFRASVFLLRGGADPSGRGGTGSEAAER